MPSTQIRFTKTTEIAEMLNAIRIRFPGMTDAELFRFAFADFYYRSQSRDENGFTHQKANELNKSLADIEKGDSEGPFDSMEDVITSLKK